jgi:hypothetical protein
MLEIALKDEPTVDDWDEYLWAVSIEGYAYDYLPQFDGASQVALEDGDEVYIWFTLRDCEGQSGKAPPFRVGMKAEPFARGFVY